MFKWYWHLLIEHIFSSTIKINKQNGWLSQRNQMKTLCKLMQPVRSYVDGLHDSIACSCVFTFYFWMQTLLKYALKICIEIWDKPHLWLENKMQHFTGKYGTTSTVFEGTVSNHWPWCTCWSRWPFQVTPTADKNKIPSELVALFFLFSILMMKSINSLDCFGLVWELFPAYTQSTPESSAIAQPRFVSTVRPLIGHLVECLLLQSAAVALHFAEQSQVTPA